MKHRNDDLARRFGGLKGAASISQFWPRGGYSEFLPSRDRSANISAYWAGAGSYVRAAEKEFNNRDARIA
jgi:hypothetical protein